MIEKIPVNMDCNITMLLMKLNEVIDAMNGLPQQSYTNQTLEEFTIDTSEGNFGTKPCNCAAYVSGQLTGGWDCPFHGHQI